MARLSICLFGPFRVTLNGEPVTGFESDKVRALLSYLAIEADVPHRREKLAGMLWSDWPERAARANLSRALANLRHCIGEREATSPLLLISQQAIQFNRAGDAWVDVAAFLDLIGLQDLSGLTAAVQLYRGHFLEAFSLSGCPEFEEWALFEGERLERLVLQALDRLSGWHEGRGKFEPALQHAWRQVELAPWQEGGHQRVMRLLARTGQRGAAIAHYETCRRCLVDELGVGPSAETVALYEQIRRETATPAPLPGPVHNLRAPLTPFVGREAELAQLGERLRDRACRLITLVGPGGIGKTRLAVEAARIHLDCFPNGVFQVGLVGLSSAQGIMPEIAQAIGFSFYRQGDPKRQLLDYLSDKVVLLILDNFEHLLDGVDIVIDLLQAGVGVKVVITSRTRLNLQGEHLFPVDGMAVPPSEAQGILALGSSRGRGREEESPLAEYDAVKLFVSGARRATPAFRLAEHAAAVSRICRLLGGMPLAILLASSWIGTLSPAEILDRMARDLDLLEAGWRDAPERHRSIRATFDYSWRLLTQRERDLFQVLSVFRGNFSLEAAQCVAEASANELWALVDKSFLHQLPTGHYELHELLQQYGAEKLAGVPGAWEAAHERHCDYYVVALRRWAEDLKGARQQAALAEMDLEVDNAQAAWCWAAERRQVARLGQAVEGLCLFCEWRGRYQEGEAACGLAAGRLTADEPGAGGCALARILAWQGSFSRLLKRSDRAAQLFRASGDVLEDPALAGEDLAQEQAFLLHQRGHLALTADRTEARRLHEQSLALFRAAGDDWWAASALREMGRLAFYSGVYLEARRWLEQSVALRQALGERRGIADSLGGLGVIARHMGQLEEAEHLLQQCLALHVELGSRAGAGFDLCELGTTLLFHGRFGQAQLALEEALPIDADLGPGWYQAHDRYILGLNELHQGRYEDARTSGQISLSQSEKVDYPRGMAQACLLLGCVALAGEACAEAWSLFGRSIALQRESGLRMELGAAHAFLGYVVCRLAQPSQAQRSLQEALWTAVEIHDFVLSQFALPGAALLLAAGGQTERAVEVYALASCEPFVGNSRWFQDVAGRRITAAAAGLPPDVVAAAQTRGRARDLWATVTELAGEWAE